MQKRKIELKQIKMGDRPESSRWHTKSSWDGKKEPMMTYQNQMPQTNPKPDTLQEQYEKVSKHSEPISESDIEESKSNAAEEGEVSKSGKKKRKMISSLEPTGATQDLIDIKDIRNGLIQTKKGKYIQILEIVPVNFYQKSPQEQMSIVNTFSTLFKEGPRTGQFKSITVNTDYQSYIRHIMESCPPSRGEKLLSMRNDYIKTIKTLGQTQTISYRYFYIYSYEGEEDGSRSSRFEDIERTMKEQKENIRHVLGGCGNTVVDFENESFGIAEILYLLLNRGKGEEEGFMKRKLKIDSDYAEYNEATHSSKRVDVASYFAPKGVYFVNSNWVMSGGIYYTYIAIKDNGYPDMLPPDWINIIRNYQNVDVDFFYTKLPHDNTMNLLDKRNFYSKINYKQGTVKKKESLAPKIRNTSLIVDGMKQGQDLFDCLTILTIRGNDPKELINQRRSFCKMLKTQGLRVEESYRNQEMYYKMTMPLCSFNNQIFQINKRNFLTSSMSTVYHFTGHESVDPTGIVIGFNLENNSLFSINNANTRYYSNGNMMILGMAGSGKSFFEMAYGRRQTIAGHKVYYILPAKGYEYKKAVMDVGGTYIRLVPGSDCCLNFMELYSYTPNQNESSPENGDSILAIKVASLCTWFRMLSIQEKNPNFMMSSMDMDKMNALLMELYHDFGITEDNDSIWENKKKGIRKAFPIFSDWKDRMEQDIQLMKYAALLLPFTEGNLRNFNGQTNVDLSKDSIVFDCDVNLLGEDKMPVIQYIAFDCAENLVKSDPNNYGVIITDEIWQMLLDEVTARKINRTCRLIRGYGGCILMASQDIEEFTQNSYGAALIGNTAIKVVLHIDDYIFDLLKPILKLKEEERGYFSSFNRGQGMFISNRERIRFQLVASINEQISYNTDVTIKQKLNTLQKQLLEEQE